MRSPYVAVGIAGLILAAFTGTGIAISGCGSSSGSASAGVSAQNQPVGDMSSQITKLLDPLVENGTITSSQESAVLEALASAMGNGPGGATPSPGATPPAGAQPTPGATPPSGAQAPSGGQAPQGGRGPTAMFSKALASLVSDGTISATQKTAIVKALSAGLQGGPSGGQQPTASSQSI
jgi:hypothetical protein